MQSRRSNYTSGKSERLEARLNKSQKELIQHAADLSGRSLTDFVISASQAAADKIIREHEVISLAAQESEKFVDNLINPPAPNKALQQAANNYKEFVNKDC